MCKTITSSAVQNQQDINATYCIVLYTQFFQNYAAKYAHFTKDLKFC